MPKRILLSYAAFVLAAGCFAWLRLVHRYGDVAVNDVLPFVIDTLLLVVALGFAIGSRSLWTRTRHSAALFQFVISSVMLILALVDQVSKRLADAQMPQLFDFMSQPYTQFALQIVFVLCLILFPVGYIWYAYSRPRI